MSYKSMAEKVMKARGGMKSQSCDPKDMARAIMAKRMNQGGLVEGEMDEPNEGSENEEFLSSESDDPMPGENIMKENYLSGSDRIREIMKRMRK